MNIVKSLKVALLGLALYTAFPTGAEAMVNVVTSYPQDAAITNAVGGEYVSVTSLAKDNNDPHAVTPKPSMSVSINKADLLITNGQDMELAWLATALGNARNPKVIEGEDNYFDPSEGVSLIGYTKDELKESPYFSLNLIAGAEKAGGGKVGLKRGNHHYWLDPANGIIVAHNIANKLAELDPAHTSQFQANANKFEMALNEKIKVWDAEMLPYKGTPIVSYHRDWNYLIERHGLNLVGYVEPRETILPSDSDLKLLITHIKESKVKLILTSTWQNQEIPKDISLKTGVVNVSLPSTVGSRVGTKGYIDMFDAIYGKLIPALKAAQ